MNNTKESDLFERFKNSVLNVDPVNFIENNLTLDGKPFKVNANGYKPFADIYRYICLQAINPDAKPVVLVKGRQVGATTMAAALEAYFCACGLYGNNGRSPMRIMHLFPTLALAAAYTKDKLQPIITQSKPVPGLLRSNGINKSFMESKMDTSSPANDNQHFKKFLGGNQVWIESTGLTGDRIRGRQLNLETELPTPENGFIKLKDLKEGDKLFDEKGNICNVTKLHPINLTPEAYKITFDDGTEVDACAEHLWATQTKKERKNKTTSIKNTKEILNTLNDKHSICTAHLVKFTKSKNRFIKSIESIASVPMRCITVDSPSHLYLITKSFIPTHNTVDVLFYDEIQDMSALSIGTAGKVATKAQYGPIGQGVQVFFGTPKQKGGAYWKMWQSSNQQYYHLGCEKCGEYFPLYRPDVNWEEIWLYGFTVKCTKCGHEQDKVEATNRGKWIGMGDKLDHQMIGYHINQLYIPDFPKEKIIAQKPENSPTNTERVYMNEVLGEFFDGEGGTISKQEIHDKCGDPGRKFSKIITPGDKVKVYAGFDWGQKANLDTIIGKRQGQSYSCAVILTAIGPKLFSVEFATRLTKNDPAEKRNIVEEMFRRYSVQLAVGDIGDAGDLTHDLQRTYGDMFLGSRANANVNGHIKFDKDIFPKVINFEKDYYISELLSLLKEGAIKFPYGSYNQVEWLVDHCCSMEIKVTSDRGGDPIRRFVKGSTPNDGLMALLNAYLAWKFDVSQGFKIKHPGSMNYESSQNQSSLSPIIGYCPDW